MTWSVSFFVPREHATAYAMALDGYAIAISQFEDSTQGPNTYRVDALFDHDPSEAELVARFALVQTQTETAVPKFTIAKSPEKDWVAETLASFNPMQIGRFWVHGSHHAGTAPPGALPLKIDAATAFGTGEHATTHGCLLALDGLAKRAGFRRLVLSSGRTPVLDVGCGTGILAMAAARVWPVNVLASDIDHEAVRVARAMVAANGLVSRVSVVQADGITQRHILTEAPYALIMANILARPLCRMARDLTDALAPSGRIVLSGLLSSQVSMVRNAFQVCGLSLEREIPVGEWSTLVVKRSGKR